jgi:hypothetical protein
VVVDAGQDGKCGFEDLGNAIRKIQIDMGIRLTFETMPIYPRLEENPVNPRYCAIGKIHYSDVDKDAKGNAGNQMIDGELLYIKPAYYKTAEPIDVRNYASRCEDFPHESTVDQFFSESQFESYRALGVFAIRRILGEGKEELRDLEGLLRRARGHVLKDGEK